MASSPTPGQTMKGNNGQAVMSIDQFLANTQDFRQRVGQQAVVDGGLTHFILPKSGLGTSVWITITGTITVAGTVTAGTFNPYPCAPFSILKRMTMSSNTSRNIRSLDGWSWYQYAVKRYGFDPFSVAAGSYSAGWNSIIGLGAQSIQPGANVAAGTYNVNITLPIPIAYNDRLDTGLLVMQMSNVEFDVDLQWGNIGAGLSATGGSNDLVSGLVGTGLSVTSNLTAYCNIDTVAIPPSMVPNDTMILSVASTTQPSLVQGDNTYLPPPQELYTMLGLEFFNNGARLAPANFGTTRLSYGGNIDRYIQDAALQAAQDTWRQKRQPTDGMLWWDMGYRTGLDARRDLNGALNAAQITDLKLVVNLPSTLNIQGNSGMKLIRESLERALQG